MLSNVCLQPLYYQLHSLHSLLRHKYCPQVLVSVLPFPEPNHSNPFVLHSVPADYLKYQTIVPLNFPFHINHHLLCIPGLSPLPVPVVVVAFHWLIHSHSPYSSSSSSISMDHYHSIHSVHPSTSLTQSFSPC